MSFVDLVPSTTRIVEELIAEFNEKHHIAYESSDNEEHAEMDMGKFLIDNINIIISMQKYTLMLEHMQWLTMLIMSYLPRIYGEGHPKVIQMQQALKQIYDNKINILVCPRRWAKTHTTCMFKAMCGFSLKGEPKCKGEVWVITAPNVPCSCAALSVVKKLISQIHAHYKLDLITKNDSIKEFIFLNYHGHMYLRENNITDMRPSRVDRLYALHPEFFAKFNVLAATVEGVRGPEGSSYNDEYLYEDPEAQAAIVPLVRQGNYIMINTCTRNEYDESSQLENSLAKRTSDGRPIVNSLVWSRICPKCRGEGKTECKDPMPQPPWINAESEAIKLYMETIPTKNNRAGTELDNETASREVEPFFKNELPEFDDPTWLYPTNKMHQLEWILVSTDPAGGGNESTKNSKFISMFIGITYRNEMIVSFLSFLFCF